MNFLKAWLYISTECIIPSANMAACIAIYPESNSARNIVVMVECIYELYVFSHSVATSSAECS